MQPSPLVRIYPAIDQERLVGHVGVDNEHHDGFNHVFRLAEPANRDARHQFLLGTWPTREHTCLQTEGMACSGCSYDDAHNAFMTLPS